MNIKVLPQNDSNKKVQMKKKEPHTQNGEKLKHLKQTRKLRTCSTRHFSITHYPIIWVATKNRGGNPYIL